MHLDGVSVCNGVVSQVQDAQLGIGRQLIRQPFDGVVVQAQLLQRCAVRQRVPDAAQPVVRHGELLQSAALVQAGAQLPDGIVLQYQRVEVGQFLKPCIVGVPESVFPDETS